VDDVEVLIEGTSKMSRNVSYSSTKVLLEILFSITIYLKMVMQNDIPCFRDLLLYLYYLGTTSL